MNAGKLGTLLTIWSSPPNFLSHQTMFAVNISTTTVIFLALLGAAMASAETSLLRVSALLQTIQLLWSNELG